MPQPPATPPVALVTGGARRVGRAIIQRLAAAGFDIAFTYFHSEADAHSLAAQSPPRGKCLPIQADLTQPAESSESIFIAVQREFGRLDLLVNNASLYQPATLSQTTLDLARRLNAIHFESPLLLAQKFESLLRASRGHIVNLVDLMAQRPAPQYLAYCASKAALANLTLGLARALAPQVTVNAIAPGVVEWPPGYPPADKERYLKRVPLERAGSPDDVASLVLFLATEGSYINGQILRLDGGRSIT